MALTNERKKELRTIGHTLNPVVTIASGGLSDSVLAEISRALNDHELIKVKILVSDRAHKQQLIAELCEKTSATLVQSVGHVALILKEAKKPKAQLSNLKRSKRSK